MMWLLAGAAHAACTVISGATVHATGGDEAQKGTTVVLKDDRIAAIGRGMREVQLRLDRQQRVTGASYRTEPCEFVQAAGQHLTAGLTAVPAQLGLVEISLERSTRDDDADTDDRVRAALRIVDGYDPRSPLIRVSRAEGLTSAVVFPTGAFVSGFAGFVQLAGASQADAIVARDSALVIERSSGSLAEDLHQLRELVADARAYARNPRSFDQNRPYTKGASRLDLQALGPVVQKRVPMVVSANRASDLEALVALSRQIDVKLVILGAAEGWRVADLLAEAKIPVIVDPLVYGPGGFDEREGRADNAKLLAEAGVDVMLNPGDQPHNARILRQMAGNAVRGGLPHATAIDAITATPARVFGEADRGALARDAYANVALWTGDPLELSTSLVTLWIEGATVDLRNRQTELAKKYLQLPGTPVPPLSLPDGG